MHATNTYAVQVYVKRKLVAIIDAGMVHKVPLNPGSSPFIVVETSEPAYVYHYSSYHSLCGTDVGVVREAAGCRMHDRLLLVLLSRYVHSFALVASPRVYA